MPINVDIKTRALPSGQWSSVSSYAFSNTQTAGCQSSFASNSEVNFSWSSSNLESDDYVIYKRGSTEILRIDSLNPSGNITVSFTLGEALCWDISIGSNAPSACSDNSDCGPCEKCVDGECVPCDECRDGLGQIVQYLYDPVSLVHEKVIAHDVDFSSGSTITVQVTAGVPLFLSSYRLQSPKGFPAGTIQVYEEWENVLGINANPTDRGLLNFTKGQQYADIDVQDWYNRIDTSVYYPVVEAFTGKITLVINGMQFGECADDKGPEPPPASPQPPTEPPPTEPPEEPTGGDEPIEIDEPLPPQPETPLPPQPQPPEPQTGCECEIYQAKMIISGLQEVRNAITYHQNKLDARLADGDRVLFGRLTSMERVIFQQLSETNRLLYQLSSWFGNNFFSELLKIRQAVETGLVKENKAVLESISDNLEFNNKGIAEILDGKDMVVFVENEERVSTSVYRTPDSHINISQMIE